MYGLGKAMYRFFNFGFSRVAPFFSGVGVILAARGPRWHLFAGQSLALQEVAAPD